MILRRMAVGEREVLQLALQCGRDSDKSCATCMYTGTHSEIGRCALRVPLRAICSPRTLALACLACLASACIEHEASLNTQIGPHVSGSLRGNVPMSRTVCPQLKVEVLTGPSPSGRQTLNYGRSRALQSGELCLYTLIYLPTKFSRIPVGPLKMAVVHIGTSNVPPTDQAVSLAIHSDPPPGHLAHPQPNFRSILALARRQYAIQLIPSLILRQRGLYPPRSHLGPPSSTTNVQTPRWDPLHSQPEGWEAEEYRGERQGDASDVYHGDGGEPDHYHRLQMLWTPCCSLHYRHHGEGKRARVDVV